jgi:hypothetical protein
MWVNQKEKLAGFLEKAKEIVKEMKSKEKPKTAEEIDEQLNDAEVR